VAASVYRECAEHALPVAWRAVNLGVVVQHRAGARVVADLQHAESTRVVGCLLRLLPPAERVQGLSAAHIRPQLDRRLTPVRQYATLVPLFRWTTSSTGSQVAPTAAKPAQWMDLTTTPPRRSISKTFCLLHCIQLHSFSSARVVPEGEARMRESGGRSLVPHRKEPSLVYIDGVLAGHHPR